MNYSLQRRVILTISLVLALFVGMTGVVVEREYRNTVEAKLHERLQGRLNVLLATATFGDEGRISLPKLRLSQPWVGGYAQVKRNQGSLDWASSTHEELKQLLSSDLKPGEYHYDGLQLLDGTRLLSLSIGLVWQDRQERLYTHTFSVAEDRSGTRAEIALFQRNLWSWLIAMVFLMLLVQWGILRWGLAPLRQVVTELSEIEEGSRKQLEGDYPQELVGLTANLNALLRHQQEQLERHRNALSNLAHSLKTPLAVLTTLRQGQDHFDQVQEQAARMAQLVDYQLQHAATAGHSVLQAPLKISPIIERITTSLEHVYAEKAVILRLYCDHGITFRGEEGDLLELFGNVIDNAFKWCKQHVSVTIRNLTALEKRGVEITVTDDGEGFPQEVAAQLLKRGERADESMPGQGLGLAIVNDIAHAYDGEVMIERSKQGGARVTVRLY